MNRIDELMSLDPMDMTRDDLSEIVAYHRKNRALSESGVKPKREQGPKVSLDAVMNTLKAGMDKPTEPAVGRRKIT